MASKPKVSIILPAYNSEAFIADMIGDIIGQDFADWQLIVVSNGANQQNQLSVLQKLADADSRIEIIHTQEAGVSNARNIGIVNASGEWLTFVDADDRISKNHLSKLVEATDDKTDVIISGIELVNSAKKNRAEWKCPDSFGINREFLNMHRSLRWSPCNKLYRTATLTKAGIKFDTSYTHSEDAIFNCRLYPKLSGVKMISHCGYSYIQHGDSAVSKYHPNYYETHRELLRLERELCELSELSLSETETRIGRMDYFYTAQAVLNLYRQGAPKSRKFRVDRIRQIAFDNNRYGELFKAQFKPEGAYLKIFNLCLKTKSPFLTELLTRCFVKAKATFK